MDNIVNIKLNRFKKFCGAVKRTLLGNTRSKNPIE